jgi:hypothetical protein
MVIIFTITAKINKPNNYSLFQFESATATGRLTPKILPSGVRIRNRIINVYCHLIKLTFIMARGTINYCADRNEE